MTEVTVRENRQGEAVLNVRVTGDGEIFRYAFYMAHGPVEHLAEAQRVFRYLRRRWGVQKFREHDRRITGGKVTRCGWQRDPEQPS